jgi:hypothetical protein
MLEKEGNRCYNESVLPRRVAKTQMAARDEIRVGGQKDKMDGYGFIFLGFTTTKRYGIPLSLNFKLQN